MGAQILALRMAMCRLNQWPKIQQLRQVKVWCHFGVSAAVVVNSVALPIVVQEINVCIKVSGTLSACRKNNANEKKHTHIKYTIY